MQGIRLGDVSRCRGSGLVFKAPWTALFMVRLVPARE